MSMRGGEIAEFPTISIKNVIVFRRKVKKETVHFDLLSATLLVMSTDRYVIDSKIALKPRLENDLK